MSDTTPVESRIATEVSPIGPPPIQEQRRSPVSWESLLSDTGHEELRNILKNVCDDSQGTVFRKLVKEDLFNARISAQEEMNKHQKSEKLIFNGFLNDLELERIKVEKRGLEAVFLAQGNIQMTR